MATVTIFRVETYDAETDSVIRSKRTATLKGVVKMNGWAIGEGVAVDAWRGGLGVRRFV
jgi:hypothetical protein